MNMNKVRNTSTLVNNLNNESATAEEGVTCTTVSRAPRMAESIAAKLREKLCHMIDTKSLSLREAASKLGLSVTKAKELLKDTTTRKRLVAQNVNETNSASTTTTTVPAVQQPQQLTLTPAQVQAQLLSNGGVMNCVQYQYTINIDTVVEMVYCLPGLPPMSMQTLISDTITTDMVFTYLDSPANIANNTTTTTATATPTAGNEQYVGDFTNYANLLAAAAMMGSIPNQNANMPLSPMASGGVLPQITLLN